MGLPHCRGSEGGTPRDVRSCWGFRTTYRTFDAYGVRRSADLRRSFASKRGGSARVEEHAERAGSEQKRELMEEKRM
eukprot:scaffold358_cov343-Pavlova_lutheri.AAC.46